MELSDREKFFLVGLLGVFVGMALGYVPGINREEVVCSLTERVVTKIEPSAARISCSTAPESRGYRADQFGGEIPLTWSFLKNGDGLIVTDKFIGVEVVMQSFSPNPLQFSDVSFEQVDFYRMSTEVAQSRIARYAKEEGVIETHETAGGMRAVVITFPLDNGEASKNGTGGKSYFINSKDLKNPPSRTEGTYLLVSKQALGSEVFELAFQHYLDTVDFSHGW